MLTLTITETDHCRRVESLLQNVLPAAPLSYLRKILKSGHVVLNGHPALPDDTVRLGDNLGLKESGRLRSFTAGKRPALDILFEDQWIIIFNKAPGVPVHRAAEVDQHNLVELGEAFLRKRDSVPPSSPLKLLPVNRLDRGTSGAIVFAKSPTAAGIFGRMVREEGFGKLYLAITEGKLPSDGSITAPLEGKESETRYKVLLQAAAAAFVAVTPLTGRMHQIRQHFRLIGHPIVGDKRYGGRIKSGFAGHALHSFRTSFTHPVTGVPHSINAPLPEAFLKLGNEFWGDEFNSVIMSLPELDGQSSADNVS